MTSDITQDFFMDLAEIAARESLPFFRQPIAVDNKKEAYFDPVTQADRQTEAALRQFIRLHRPQDSILGEEVGLDKGENDYTWVIDPIDGTRSFICGVPVWGTLVGLLHQTRAIAGMMAQPFTGELFYANETGSFFTRHGGDGCYLPVQKLKTRTMTNLEEATLFTTAPAMFDERTRNAFQKLEKCVKLTRFGTDCYAPAMLAAGFVDLVVEAGVQPYDIIALIPIIEQAGGVVTCWDGTPAEKAGNIIAAATPQLHARALEILQTFFL